MWRGGVPTSPSYDTDFGQLGPAAGQASTAPGSLIISSLRGVVVTRVPIKHGLEFLENHTRPTPSSREVIKDFTHR